jgi:hypothetical protein
MNSIIQKLSENILIDFKEKNIKLAFNPITVEMADKKSR